MKKNILFIIVATTLLASTGVHAQEDKAFDAWKKADQKKLQEFRNAEDRAFYEFLQKEWRGMRLAKGAVKDPIPDLPKPPVYQPPVVKQAPPAPPAPAVTLPPPPKKETVEVPPPPSPVHGLEVKYFGLPILLPITESMKVPFGDTPNKESISDFFAAMTKVSTDDMLSETRKISQARQLNDWGYCLLLHAAGERLYGPSSDGAALFTWYLLLKSGFDARVGYTSSHVILLLPAEEQLFGAMFLTLGSGSRRYYVLHFDARASRDETQLYTYEGSYPSAVHALKFAVNQIPVLGNQVAEKTLSFTFGGAEHRFPLKYSRDAVTFFEHYPQTDFTVYFDGSVSDGAASSLYSSFKPLLADKNEVEAVNILLRFSQTAFGYKVDKELFGREKPMFTDEVLYYDFSNCKDRAILFAYLVRRLTGLEVVGLDYPGHISTAVRFRGNVAGDGVTVKGQRYVICDPTYINADAGMCMPQFRGIPPTIIALKKPQ
jgi:hypothetical protein